MERLHLLNQNLKNYFALASAMVGGLNTFLLSYAAIPDTAALVPGGVYIVVGGIAAMFAAGSFIVNNLPIERTTRTVSETPEGDKVTETIVEKPIT